MSLEVPAREVLHDFGEDQPEGLDYLGHVGYARTDLDWPPPEKGEIERFRAELKDREARRLPFGFRSAA